MTDLLLFVIVVGPAILMLTTLAALRRVWHGGRDQTEEFLRSGVSVKGLWKGEVPDQESGSLITVREGMDLTSNGGCHHLVQTSTISRDLY